MTRQATLLKRFEELAARAEPIEASKRHERSDYLEGFRIDDDKLLSWRVKIRNLLVMACGRDSEHFKEFTRLEEPQSYRDHYRKFKDLCSVFFAAKEDYEGGYIVSLCNLVQAE